MNPAEYEHHMHTAESAAYLREIIKMTLLANYEFEEMPSPDQWTRDNAEAIRRAFWEAESALCEALGKIIEE